VSTWAQFRLSRPSDRLDSWKEIAIYLNRSVRTVRRWEWLEGLPVHRQQHQKRASVYAYKPELDAWRESRNLNDAAPPEAPPRNSSRQLRFIVGAVASLTLIFALASWSWSKRDRVRPTASQIPTSLTPQQQTRQSTTRQVDAEAHEFHLLGQYHAKKGTEDGLNRSISYFDRAIARSPEYAKPYGGLAFAYTQLSSLYLPPEVAMPKARAAALKALRLDEGLSEAHTWLGMIQLYFDWDWSGAERELRRAMELNPNSADARVLYQHYLLTLGRIDEALREAARSTELDPLSVHVLAEAQFANLIARKNDEAIAIGRRLEVIEPRFGTSHLYSGLAYVEKGDFGHALAELRTAVRIDPNATNRAYLAYVLARAGDTAGAERVLEDLKSLSARQYVCPFEVGSAYAGLGRKEEVYRWMRKGIQDRADCMIWLRSEPWLKSLRGDPEYRALAHEIGFR
jgi:tetratricopeptide (TPR) repeat protein